jgi:hypothetical protein
MRAHPLSVVLIVLGVAVAAAQDPPPRKPIIKPAAKGERQPDKLKVGSPAPDFKLPLSAGGKDVSLAEFKGKQPVVLVFASCT